MNYWQHPNNVVLGGRITADLELKEINANTKMLEFTIANNLKVSGEGHDKADKPNYFRCEAWGKVAEIIQSKFKKGEPIVIIGTLNYNTWQDKESGAKRENTKIRVETFHFVNSKSSSEVIHNDAAVPQRPVTRTCSSGEYFYQTTPSPATQTASTSASAVATWVPGPPDDSDPFKE